MAVDWRDFDGFKEENGVPHPKGADCIAQIGSKVLGYYLTQEIADNVVSNHINETIGLLSKLKNETDAERPSIYKLYDKIDEAKRIISDARAQVKKIETSSKKARKEYDAKFEEALKMFSKEEIENLLQKHKEGASIP